MGCLVLCVFLFFFLREKHCCPELARLHDHISGVVTGCVITLRQLPQMLHPLRWQ